MMFKKKEKNKSKNNEIVNFFFSTHNFISSEIPKKSSGNKNEIKKRKKI